jgi:hypothetical protein
LAQAGQLLAVVNREGNVHGSEKALETLEFLVEEVRRELAPRHLEVRFDGAFFRRDLLECQFQITTTATERKNGHKRTYRWVLESLRTFRYEVLNLPAKLARPEGRAELRIAAAENTQERIQRILDTLPEAA